ncbi:phosphoglycolate phosphatase [Mesobacterium pallidum]|uniref:phosphoglycolate phosphatase n=1 Tax=Mesobacterium pallidum TaxID=2872037 RepID=UPI001EE163BC|nr:phosphoglycolate phosphatase [Mesobacterium pallidum]
MAAIVFDLDGTLIDSAPDIHVLANRLLSAEGRAPITLEDTRSFIGNGAAVFVQRMRAARDLGHDTQDRLLAVFKAGYLTAVDNTVPYPGVVDALSVLRAEGHALGICTNKPILPTRAVLDHLGLTPMFDTILGGDSLPQHKPDPAPLHAAFAALPAGPKVYVGDSEVDAETAQCADVPFLLYTEGYRKTPVATIPHRVAFLDFSILPRLVRDTIAALA